MATIRATSKWAADAPLQTENNQAALGKLLQQNGDLGK